MKICNMKKVQHEKRATGEERKRNKVQLEYIATQTNFTMKRVQHEKSTT